MLLALNLGAKKEKKKHYLYQIQQDRTRQMALESIIIFVLNIKGTR